MGPVVGATRLWKEHLHYPCATTPQRPLLYVRLFPHSRPSRATRAGALERHDNPVAQSTTPTSQNPYGDKRGPLCRLETLLWRRLAYANLERLLGFPTPLKMVGVIEQVYADRSVVL